MIILVILLSQGNLLQLLSANPCSDTVKYQKSINPPSEFIVMAALWNGKFNIHIALPSRDNFFVDVFLFYSIVSVKEVTWKNTLLIILKVGDCTAVWNSLLKYCIKCLSWKMRFASEHEYTIFKIRRWSRAPEIKPLGQIYSLWHSNYLESVLLFKSSLV